MAKIDPERDAHKAWLGLVQPVGLVVSPPALQSAQVVPDRNVVPIQQALAEVVTRPASLHGDADPELRDFPRFAIDVLGWSPQDLAGAASGPPLPDALAVTLADYGEILRPDYVAIDSMGDGRPLLLVQVVQADLDATPAQHAGWPASPQARMERLLRDTGVPAGLLLNGAQLRLVYAPRGESSGYLGFPIAALLSVSGRPLLSALHMLLCEHRVFAAPDGQRLLDLLASSRKYQSEVSTRLADQVLGALWELLRGFQAADEAANGRVLYDLPREDPQQIYGGVLTVIMRLVFLLYAEDQGLMPDDPVYARNYAIGGLFERLREDAGRYPDTLDQRFGAWAWLLSTFRMVFDGGAHKGLRLPTRHGQLFNPDEYPFLEGRPPGVHRVMGQRFEAPRVSDGVVWRVLEGLLMLDGERLSYRALDVEQVGSVYESMMGFDVRSLPGRAVAVRPKDIVIDLDALLALPGNKRAAWLREQAECELAAGGAKALAEARTADDAVAALGRKLAPQTPRPLAPGALFLQPGEERRRSGSHYTPRELTAPIVQTTLRPVLQALGPRPTPEQILALKVCDPAMGSGAFLVEACRQLAAALLSAWELHEATPKLPPDEDPLLHARRLVAQRCLYGVDKNPFAVNLAKLSLWLVTLAKDHAFTFLDHALKHGDSLVGLSRRQIGRFDWGADNAALPPLLAWIERQAALATQHRAAVQSAPDGDDARQRAAWREAEDAVDPARLAGDLCLAAFFSAEKDKDREATRRAYQAQLARWTAGEADALAPLALARERLHHGGVRPFHWGVEFPEVFDGGGFHAIVGNPPFAGKNTLAAANHPQFPAWLKLLHEGSHGNADLVAHFFRRAYSLLRPGGALGLIATNTIAQGDTRSSGLRWIRQQGGCIYEATKRLRWPGLAAVVVSVVHISKGRSIAPARLDGREVERITAFLFPRGPDEDPAALKENEGKSFQGSIVLGMGFTFDDSSEDATPIAEMHRLIEQDPRNAERIFPYIGGEEVNSSPTHAHRRYVINFGELSEAEARDWPELMEIVERAVRGQRGSHSTAPWWQFERLRPELYRAIDGLERVLVTCIVTNKLSFAFLPVTMVFSHKLVVFPLPSFSAFALLQSRIHELWAWTFSSTMKDDINYAPADCFETFPFPPNWQTDPTLESAGQAYYELRAALMVRNDQGLTATYNRFHDPDERDPEILELRRLHAAMDRAVLNAYGWADIPTDCEFLLDYEDPEADDGARPARRKKPWRLRWPESTQSEVLARLLALNAERHAQELAAGSLGKTDKPAPKVAPKARPKAAPKAPTKARPRPDVPGLFDRREEEP